MSAAPQTTILLIDGDVLAFISAAAAQGKLIDPESGWASPVANALEGETILENMLFALRTELHGDSIEVYLSDPTDNWRTLVDPSYKKNREGLERPLLLDHLKGYLRERHGATHWPGLEADDVLGILATFPGDIEHPENPAPDSAARKIVVGRDKDFNSIPGLHHTIKKDIDPKTKRMVTREVSQWEGDRFHLIQTLAGDRVDGYAGCPGIGMVRAALIIDRPVLLVPREGVKTRGVNKGEAVTRWMAEPTTDHWACIVSHYRKAGLGEEDALRNARLARILRYGEYDRETEEVTLWAPEMMRR